MDEDPGTDDDESSSESSGTSDSEVQGAREVQGLATILGLPNFFNPPPRDLTIQRFSPFGQRLSEESGQLLARDAVTWHLTYWLNLTVLAVMHGEHSGLVALLVEGDQKSMNDADLRAELAREFTNFLLRNRDNYLEYWTQQTLDGDEARAFLRDVDNLLVDKVRRARVYLYQGEMAMIRDLRNGALEAAQRWFDILYRLHRVLSAEEARNQPPNGIHGEQAPAP